ncbi:phytanoyl-CoA dioxygenase family protein [Ruegeria sp. 2205SS24-7]|uniref:phytanoyl-CoA dioxygenase family protein n=1 Tax=Ruegeria discodermiae TaxID=3064389 RepID=UPI002741CC7A|nr:phytanoyl-CoA dioxygenase family protein [Ruegeria sp. 2205SS24-7]MDP5218905.1 phytanoyl-CoA dioxygenase family protein [Ruegeria sp. 2205SS24-7]
MITGLLQDAGWNADVPPNGFINRPKTIESNDNPDGLSSSQAEIEIETTPEHMNLVSGDPSCAAWTRAYDDPGVVGLREHLRQNNGIKGLELVSPGEVKRATELFHRDGFVAVRDVLTPEQLERMRNAAHEAVADLMEDDPDCSAGGGAGGLPHRYSFGGGSASRHMLHKTEWCELIDLPTTTPILTEIFGSPDYVVGGAGGDIAMPGAIEYQGLHSDNMWSELPDPYGNVTMRDLPVPVLTINFPMIDLTFENGPIRQIPGTQRSRAPIPSLANEPDWMKLSTVCPAPAGTAVFRDIRAWHGGTPNLSRDVRAMPNVEYYAPWFRSEGIMRCMPYEQWEKLSPHAQRISRFVVCDKGEDVVGAGFMDPRRKKREAFKQEQLDAMGEKAAREYLARL